jgi:hypothetical protein
LALIGLVLAAASPAGAQAPANDDCETAEALTFGVAVAGSTTDATPDSGAAARGNCFGFGADAAVTAPGVWYSVVGTDRIITATTCPDSPGASADFDTRVSVYCATCPSLRCITGNDDDCTAAASASTAEWCSAAGELYYLFVHGTGAETGDFELLVTDGVLFCRADSRCTLLPAPCAGSAADVIENESDCGGVLIDGSPGDTVNGGCTAPAPVFTTVSAGDTICGTTASSGTEVDEDWYEIVLAEASRVSFCAGSTEAELVIGLVPTGGSGDCADAGPPDPAVVVPPGSQDCVTVDLEAGTWWFRLAPVSGAFLPCETVYDAEVQVQPLGLPGGCCDEATGDCAIGFDGGLRDRLRGGLRVQLPGRGERLPRLQSSALHGLAVHGDRVRAGLRRGLGRRGRGQWGLRRGDSAVHVAGSGRHGLRDDGDRSGERRGLA